MATARLSALAYPRRCASPPRSKGIAAGPTITISNRDFRRTLLCLNGLGPARAQDNLPAPITGSGPQWAHEMIRRLGFVQVDSVSAVERAQHHILFSRNHRFGTGDLKCSLEMDRTLFEHWTHDAAILPVESYPYWKHCFQRQERFEIHPGYKRYFKPVTAQGSEDVIRRIETEGPLKPRDFDSAKADWGVKGIPTPSLAKITLEYLWRIGRLAVARRDKREKVYDLSHRVIPSADYDREVTRDEFVDWACREALMRLGAASASGIAHFFDAVLTEEAAAWCDRRLGTGLSQVRVTHADGVKGGAVFALDSVIEAMPDMPAASKKLRLINPFDPLVHDRGRTSRVFGFDYAIEIWVPPARRQYGYYVLPILEGARFTGRIDVKVDRKRRTLTVPGLWWEQGIEPTKRRLADLDRELRALAKFTGVDEVVFKKSER